MTNSEVLLRRIQFLSDGVFMLAMTLMVLQFNVTELEDAVKAEGVQHLLMAQLPSLGVYVITFIVLAFYWLENVKQFQYYQRTNFTHVWIQLLFIMLIVLVPYSNTLATLYPNSFSVDFFYSLNIFLVGILSYINWVYATDSRRLVASDLDEKFIRAVKLQTLVEPAVALLSLGTAFFGSLPWTLTFLLLPLGYVYLEWQDNRDKSSSKEERQ